VARLITTAKKNKNLQARATAGSHQEIPLERLGAMIGGRWTLTVLSDLAEAPRRFNELSKRHSKIPPRSLARLLRNLEKSQLITRGVASTRPPAVTYSLLHRDDSFGEVLELLKRWADTNLSSSLLLAPKTISDGGSTFAPLGMVKASVALGQHVAFLWKNANDINSLLRFWTIAEEAAEFLLIGPTPVIDLVREQLRFLGRTRADAIEKKLNTIVADKCDAHLAGLIFQQMRAALNRGAHPIRALGFTAGWNDNSSAAGTHACETKVTKDFAGLPGVMICPYRVKEFSGPALLKRALETHSLVISGNKLLRNPFFETDFSSSSSD
jgi:DNA-binding HxlR family transcriptional regulator